MLKCTRCGSTKITLYKVKFANDSRHVRGFCECGRYRDLPKGTYYSHDLPWAPLKKDLKRDRKKYGKRLGNGLSASEPTQIKTVVRKANVSLEPSNRSVTGKPQSKTSLSLSSKHR